MGGGEECNGGVGGWSVGGDERGHLIDCIQVEWSLVRYIDIPYLS